MDRRTRKILAMNGCLHTRTDVARLYLQIPSWLPKREHRVVPLSCDEGESDR